MSDMVERVAMALAADIEEGFPRFTQQRWDDLTELARATMRQRARVAIEAMREPTDGMVLVFAHGFSDDNWGTMTTAAEARKFTNAEYAWRAMIDAALE